MQISIDGRIYVARDDKYLGTINRPNAYGTACQYVDKSFYLANKESKFGLPTFNQSYFYNPEYSFENFCYGDTTLFNVMNSSLIDSIKWNFGDNGSSNNYSDSFNAKHKYSASGIYTVSLLVYLISTKVDTLNWTIRIHPKPNADFSINDSTQCQKENQVFFLDKSTITTGTTKSLWDFGNGDTSSLTNPLYSYSYDDTFNVKLVSISDKGCKDTITKKMYVFPSPKPDFIMNDSAQCFDRNKYEFTNKSTIRYGSINYNWDFGDGNTSKFDNPTHVYTSADTFIVTLIATSNLFCRDTIKKSTYVTLNPTPIGAFAINDTFQCLYGNKFLLTNNSYLSTGTMSYRWSFGDGDSSIAFEPQHAYLTEGNYNIKLTVISDKNCKDHITKKVYVNPEPIADFSVADSAQCLRNNKVKFTNKTSIAYGKLNYTWAFGDNNYSNLQHPEYTYTFNDTFTISLLVISEGGCIDSLKKSVIIHPMPIVDYSINNESQCLRGNAFQFTNESSIASGSITMKIWEMGDGKKYYTNNATHNYATEGTYDTRLTLVSNLGCRDSLLKKVYVHPMPKAFFSTNKFDQCLDKNFFICKDSSTISSGFITSLLWNMDDGNTFTDKVIYHNYTYSDTFNIKLIATSDKECKESIINKVLVYPLPKPAFDISNPNQCLSGNSFAFQNKSTISSGTINQLLWTLGDGTIKSSTNVTHSYSNHNTYNVKLVVTSGAGCKDSISKTVFVYPMPEADFTVNNLKQCLTGNNFSFSNKSSVISGSIASSLWFFGDGTTSSLNNPDYTYSEDKTYNVKLLVNSNNGCKDSFFTNITVQPMPKVDFNISNPCLDKQTYFEDKTTINNPGVLNNWQWQINGIDFSTQQNPVNSFSTPGIFNINLMVSSSDNCKSSFNKFMKINEHVSKNRIIRASVVNNSEIIIEWTPSTTGSVKYYVLERSEDGINYKTLANLPFDVFKFNDKNIDASARAYYYRIAVSDSCNFITPYSNLGKTIHLKVNAEGDQPELSWNLYKDWENGVFNQEILMKDDKGAYKTIETVSNTTTQFTDTKTESLLDEYCYKIVANENVTGIISNSNTVCVSVPLLIFIPNAFTPNRDEVNDEFVMVGKYITSFYIQIFDRWGELLFESNDITKSWDGKYKGEICPAGLYYFRLVAKGTQGQVKVVNSTINLLR